MYGWLQLRFDRAFGVVPGIIITGLSFTAYHIGTYSPAALMMLFFSGLFYALVFRITSNLLIIWPLAFCFGSAIGTLMGGMQFTWGQVASWAVIMLLQIGFIGYTCWWQSRR